jgi:hypothetical protein
MTLEQIGILAAIVLGLYGAILSTINTVMDWRRQARRIRPAVSWGMPIGLPGFDGLVVIMEALNVGGQPVALTDFGPSLSGRSSRPG